MAEDNHISSEEYNTLHTRSLMHATGILLSPLTVGLSFLMVPLGHRLREYDGKANHILRESHDHADGKALPRSNTKAIHKDGRSSLYHPLNQQAGEIRLLRLLRVHEPNDPGLPNQYITLAMRTVSLNATGLEYDALSYVWGEAECTKQVEVNGESVPVTDNLFAALLCLSRLETPTRDIWIDAICIDQQNLSECAHQVSLMRQLYAGAKDVHISLGSEPAISAAMFKSVKEIATEIAAGVSMRSQITAGRLDDAHLRELFMSPWWTRLWVLQEAALAKHPVVHWGAENIPFWDLMGVMAAARIAKVDGDYDFSSSSQRDNQEEWLYNFERAVYSFTVMAVLKERNVPPELVLSVSSYLESTYEHDRIYGVLALIPSLKSMAPDYEEPASIIFQKTTVSVMKHRRRLRLLRLIRRSKDVPARGPSWVPAFGGMEGLIGQHKENFGLQGCNQPSSFLLEEEGKRGIRINAREVDEIAIVGSACGLEAGRKDGASSETANIQEHLRLILRSWLDMACNTPQREHLCSRIDEIHADRYASSCVKAAFWKTIFCDGLFNLVTGRGNQNLEKDMEECDDWLLSEELDKQLSTYQWLQLQLLAGASTFFVTEAGRMGLSRSDVQKGDMIAILGGETVPYVLRARPGTRSRHFILVGSCFCNGTHECGWTTGLAD